jgi:hypothetical protein
MMHTKIAELPVDVRNDTGALKAYAKLLQVISDLKEGTYGQDVQPDPQYVSPNLPAGYDTVLGFLARTNPEALALLDEDPECTKVDGIWLRERAKMRNLFVTRVEAPAFLQQFGIREVHAYPVDLLAERLG